MRTLVDNDDDGTTPALPEAGATIEQPAWMRTLADRCREWTSLLPATINTLQKVPTDNQNPLYRLFLREGSVGLRLLAQVRKDLSDILLICQGSLKQTNHLRDLMSHLTKGTIPRQWRKYVVKKSMSLSEWMPNFARRLEQLDSIATLGNLNNVEVWLGGLFFPEAYITATRQTVAHRKKWSLETLNLNLDIERVDDPGAFIVDGLVLEGASFTAGKLALNDGASVRLGPSQLRWVQTEDSGKEQNAGVNLPVYLNKDRSDILFTIRLPFNGVSSSLVAMRGVCLTASG